MAIYSANLSLQRCQRPLITTHSAIIRTRHGGDERAPSSLATDVTSSKPCQGECGQPQGLAKELSLSWRTHNSIPKFVLQLRRSTSPGRNYLSLVLFHFTQIGGSAAPTFPFSSLSSRRTVTLGGAGFFQLVTTTWA